MFKKMILGILVGVLSGFIYASPIKIVAAENFYGELAKEIGGANVSVQSIISNPDADPHLFTTSPDISKSLEEAQIIIYNGANYDPWMDQMLKSLKNESVLVINVADLMKLKYGNNPHIWYRPDTFPALANKLADMIVLINQQSAKNVNSNLFNFLNQNKPVQDKIKMLNKQYNGVTVTATEPVFGYMADAIGLKMEGLDFQWKIMNDTEPTPKMIASYEELITNHKVKVLFYNKQVNDPVSKNILVLAKKNNIPSVGVTETIPQNTKINQWLLNELTQTATALKAGNK